MNEAHFKILEFTVPSGTYRHHDDGYVSSISDTTMRVNELYSLNNQNYDTSADKYVIGRHYGIERDSHIFYLERPTIALDIQNRSHEETHALEFIGQLDALTDRLFEEQGVKINLKEVDDREVRAQLGSLYALNARDLALWKLELLYKNETFSAAKKIYKQSKQLQRKFFTF